MTVCTVWKLREFILTHFWQKFRESNCFTKEITTLSVRIIMATRLFIFWKKLKLHALIRRLHDYQFSSKSIQMLQFVYNYHIKTMFFAVLHGYLGATQLFHFWKLPMLHAYPRPHDYLDTKSKQVIWRNIFSVRVNFRSFHSVVWKNENLLSLEK